MRTIGSMMLAALLFTGCSTADNRPGQPPPLPTSTGSEGDSSSALRNLFEVDAVDAASRCSVPQVFITTPSGTQAVATDSSEVETLRVRTGDTVTVRATGNCGHTVHVTSRNSRLVARQWTGPGRYIFDAQGAGSVDLSAYTSHCARPRGFESSECRGGIVPLFDVQVDVLA